MSGVLKSTREDLAETLSEALSEGRPEFKVGAFLPARPSVDSGFIIPGAPYLEDGEVFGEWMVRLEAHLLFQGVNNETGTENLDDHIEDAMVAAVQAGWSVESVSEPFQATYTGATFLAVQMQVTRAISL